MKTTAYHHQCSIFCQCTIDYGSHCLQWNKNHEKKSRQRKRMFDHKPMVWYKCLSVRAWYWTVQVVFHTIEFEYSFALVSLVPRNLFVFLWFPFDRVAKANSQIQFDGHLYYGKRLTWFSGRKLQIDRHIDSEFRVKSKCELLFLCFV